MFDDRTPIVGLDYLLEVALDDPIRHGQVVQCMRELTTKRRVVCFELDEIIVAVNAGGTVNTRAAKERQYEYLSSRIAVKSAAASSSMSSRPLRTSCLTPSTRFVILCSTA